MTDSDQQSQQASQPITEGYVAKGELAKGWRGAVNDVDPAAGLLASMVPTANPLADQQPVQQPQAQTQQAPDSEQ